MQQFIETFTNIHGTVYKEERGLYNSNELESQLLVRPTQPELSRASFLLSVVFM